MNKIGLCSVTFRNKSAYEILDLAIKNGLNFIEWGGDTHLLPGDFEKAKELKELCKKNNIEYSYGSYYKYRNDDNIDVILDTAEVLGSKDVRIWATRISSSDISPEEYSRFINKSKDIADKAKKKNINIHFEDHRKTLTDTSESAKKILTDIGKDNVYMYWQPQGDESEEERLRSIEILKDRITNVHVFYWDSEFIRYPLSDAKEFWRRYVEALGGERAYLLEFVKNDSLEQFSEDVKVLKEILGE